MPDFTILLEYEILKGKDCILFIALKINVTLVNLISLNLIYLF